MSKITVSDVINLPVMKNSLLVAGKSGLSNVVNNPNVYDNPYSSRDPEIYHVDNDIIITSFYFGKDNPEYIEMVFRYFLSVRASAVCITDIYISDIPENVKSLCDEHNLPVFFLNEEVSYSEFISSIIECRRSFENASVISTMLSNLISAQVPDQQKERIIEELNPNFWNSVVVYYAIEKNTPQSEESLTKRYIQKANDIKTGISGFASEYRNGLLYITSLRDIPSELHLRDQMEYAIQNLRRILPDSIIGVSEILPKKALGKGILQAFMSVYSGAESHDDVILYKSLGLTRLLVSIQDSPALDEFYTETITPIIRYDSGSNTNLLDTLICFMENGMDYAATADAMFVHRNTIRYRLSKIRELINFGKTENDFYETLSIIYKIYRLKGLPKNNV